MNRRPILIASTLVCALAIATYLLFSKDSEDGLLPTDGPSAQDSSDLSRTGEQADEVRKSDPTRHSDTEQSAPMKSREAVSAAPDLFELMRSLAKRAYDGESEAQLTIARAMALCMGSLPFADEATNALAHPAHTVPVGEMELHLRDVGRCKRMREGDPFAELPSKEGGYTFEYWLKRAVDAGHPLAGAIDATNRIAKITNDEPSKERDSELRSIEAQLERAVRADTPEHHYYVGRALLLADNIHEPDANIRGVAWMLMTCRAGGCTDIPEPRTWTCPPGLGNTCDELSAASYQLEQQLGRERYAQALQLSHEIEDLVRKKDWDALDISVRPGK